MFILIFIVSLVLCLLFGFLYTKVDNYSMIEFDTLSVIFGVIAFISIIVTLILGITCAKCTKLDDIIAMYQEENESIESKMDDLVKGYMDYEKNTLTEFAPESSITLVSLYPELKSDELVKQQIDVYMANNQKIKGLKEKQIYADVYRWWLYFGG